MDLDGPEVLKQWEIELTLCSNADVLRHAGVLLSDEEAAEYEAELQRWRVDDAE